MPPRASRSTKPVRTRVRIAGGVVILAAVYLAAVVGDVLLGWRERAIDAATHSRYAEASAIEAKRFREQDVAAIQAALADGYAQNLYLSSFDSSSRHRALVQTYGIAPLAPQPRSKLQYCNEGYGLVRYLSDRYGFRNDDSIWDAKRLDAVLIGDSFVHGACVGQDDTISGLLSEHGLAVLNLGTGGNGPIQYAALAKTFVPRTAPRFVIVFFHPNDNLDETVSVYRKVFFGDVEAQYFAQQPGEGSEGMVSNPLAALYDAAKELLRYPSAGAEIRPAPLAGRKGGEDSFFARVMLALRLAHVRRSIAAAVGDGHSGQELPWSSQLAVDTTLAACQEPACTPVFVYLANSDYWSPDYRAEEYKHALNAYVRSQAVDAHFLDTTEGISALGMQGFAPAGKHYSPKGYASVASQVRREIHRLDNASPTNTDRY